MLEDAADDLRVFDAGDDLHRAATVLAGLDLDAEDAFEELRPTHRGVRWHRTALPRACRTTAAALGGHDLRTQAVIRCKHPVVARQVHSGAGHQSGQPGQKIQRAPMAGW